MGAPSAHGAAASGGPGDWTGALQGDGGRLAVTRCARSLAPLDFPFATPRLVYRRDFLAAGVLAAAARAFRAPRGIALGGDAASAGLRGETGAADRMQWWRDARFGMFVHFGLYSTLGGEWKGKLVGSHEWIRNNAKIPHEDYIRIADTFDPVALDVDGIVQLAKHAGQKYIVVTTKHHEGFSLWDSASTTYDVMATPYRRDIMRQFADACRRHDMRLGWYYSIMDWYHPDYLPRRDWESRDARGADFPRYVAFMHAQLRELLTHYGRIDVLWFDGQWEATWTRALAADVVRLCRSLQPDVIINNRVGPGPAAATPGTTSSTPAETQLGDFSTPELEVPAKGLPGEDWESCMTMNDNWGYAKDDDNWKSPARLVSLLVETASKGGNLLLNIGPMGDGRVPQPSIDALRAVGDWMRTNGAAIYGTSSSLVDTPACRTTTRGRTINCFMERWTPGPLLLPGVATSPLRAHLLGDPGVMIAVRRTSEGSVLELPDRAPDRLTPVIQVEYDAPPRTAQ